MYKYKYNMENINKNNYSSNQSSAAAADDFLARTNITAAAFEYSFPINNDSDESESNKSTPYYTPMEFLQSTFDFPSPNFDKSSKISEENYNKTKPTTTTTTAITTIKNKTAEFVDDKENTKPKHQKQKKDHDNIRKASSENNSPLPMPEELESPKILNTASDGGTTSTTTMSNSRLSSYSSPKLLASINNINISGSPLAVISSAGYKNGNYFKFPEIDHIVKEQIMKAETQLIDETSGGGSCDNQSRNKQKSLINKLGNTSIKSRSKTVVCEIEAAKVLTCDELERKQKEHEVGGVEGVTCRIKGHRNRKNKNNLTIKITDAPQSNHHPLQQISPMASTPTTPKPKTPTIKNTKEKALSLDSAPVETELTIIISNSNDTHVSCDAMGANTLNALNTCQQLRRQINECNAKKCSNRSTSLSQLSSYMDSNNVSSCTSSLLCKPLGNNTQRFGDNIQLRTPRRRIPITSNSGDWAFVHRKQHNNSINLGLHTNLEINENLQRDREDPYERHMRNMADVMIVDECNDDDDAEFDHNEQQMCSTHTPSPSSCLLSTTSHRGGSTTHKHNPLLHSSNTNLKTLPEFLTLVEFSPSSNNTISSNIDYTFKHKSADLVNSTLPLPIVQPYRIKQSTAVPSTNLLQRRGSNHSLTLNLHGSCSNLLGSGRSYPSISNYSLGSVDNSTTNLNSKSSCNLDLSTVNAAQMLTAIQSNVASTQATKQSLFRRRGSNHSLTLNNITATSCGNLNTFASQNSLNFDQRSQMAGLGVTRTTSFTKRGLLERRGSNQSLTLNMGSFGGVGSAERGHFARSNLCIDDACAEESYAQEKEMLPVCCPQVHHRKFFSSESLNKSNNDLEQPNRRSPNQVCFGSATDLKPTNTEYTREELCTCTGVSCNIMTRPLSPQTTSEEFKIYLANIQMLQNASNALNHIDLIKLNYIFDNSYSSTNSNKITDHTLPVVLSSINSSGSKEKEAETPSPGILATSEDYEVDERFQKVVHSTLEAAVLPDEKEQKRIFCDLHKEFWDLPLNHQEKPMVFGSQTKNRYKTILPNENSRFILEQESKQIVEIITKNNIRGDEEEDSTAELTQLIANKCFGKVEEVVPYINANYIKGPDFNSKCYIATQGPLPNTIYEFWLMVYQNTQKYFSLSSDLAKQKEQYYQKLVMLTNFVENNRQKCSIYFPVELNEIYVIAGKEEPMHPTKLVTEFFDKYLKESDQNINDDGTQSGDTSSSPFVRVELQQTHVADSLFKDMPAISSTAFFVVKNVGIVKKNGFSIRKLIILYCINLPQTQKSTSNEMLIQKLYCYHYWYPDWPDHRSPKDINTLLDLCLHLLNLGKCESEFELYSERRETIMQLRKDMEKMQKMDMCQQDIYNTVQPLPVIHCSAGIGRTGCFTAILNGIRQLRQSLAYSLTAMASEVSGPPTTLQIQPKPTNFYLPAYFLNEVEMNSNIVLNSDTDSTFTYNTILHLIFILQQNSRAKEKLNSNENSAKIKNSSPAWQRPSLSDLPHMPDIFVDILGIVCNLRLQRGGMVQNSEQYELIHRSICLYLKRTFAIKRF